MCLFGSFVNPKSRHAKAKLANPTHDVFIEKKGKDKRNAFVVRKITPKDDQHYRGELGPYKGGIAGHEFRGGRFVAGDQKQKKRPAKRGEAPAAGVVEAGRGIEEADQANGAGGAGA